jgi:hypothetical protein
MLSARKFRQALKALLLLLPVAGFYWVHFHPTNAALLPTGFVQYDQPYYMANARQYLDGDTDGLRYALPFSPDAAARPIHFQPQTLVLAGLWRITRADPGTVFMAFGAVAAFFCVLLALRLLDAASGTAPLWTALLFIWGGGLLAIAGFGYGKLHGLTDREALWGMFRFDPGSGWWFMNLGRNLLFPLEAYYHALFFGMVLLLRRQRLVAALMVGAVLGLSHPFTGAAALLLLLAWGLVERLVAQNDGVRWPWIITAAALLFLLLLWHRAVLPADAEHASVMRQWELPWLVEAESALPAYALVGLLAAARLRSKRRMAQFLAVPLNRFLLVWAAVFLALENHELVMDPIQPAHFTRGYAWTALFLIGAPVMTETVGRIRARFARVAAGSALAVLFLLDNAAWLSLRAIESRNATGDGIRLTAEQVELYDWLQRSLPERSLLVADDPMVAYLALVYTRHRAWYSHFANTPEADRRLKAQQDYFSGARIDEGLRIPHHAIVHGARPHPFPDQAETVHANARFTVYSVRPR